MRARVVAGMLVLAGCVAPEPPPPPPRPAVASAPVPVPDGKTYEPAPRPNRAVTAPVGPAIIQFGDLPPGTKPKTDAPASK